jgi:hypothetical protein
MDMQGEMFEYYMTAAAALGLIECFFGYRILRFLLGVIGFIIGAVIAGSLGFELSDGSELISIAAAIAGGCVGAYLMYLLYIAGVFVIGAALGFMVVSFIFGLMNENPVTWIVIASSVAGGILAVIFQRPMIVIATSFGGSYAAVTSISYLLMRNFNPLEPGFLNTLGENQLYRMAIIWFALGVFGFVVQYMMLYRAETPVESDADENTAREGEAAATASEGAGRGKDGKE